MSFAVFVGTSKEQMAYQAFCDVNDETDTFGFCDPLVFQASTKLRDPDLPIDFEAMTSDNHEQICKAMENEITELEQKNTWMLTKCSDIVK